MRIVVQGTERIKVVEWKQQDPHMRAMVQILPEPHVVDPEEVEAAKRNLQEMIQQALALLPVFLQRFVSLYLGQLKLSGWLTFLAQF